MARQGLKTENIDHHRTGDLGTLFDALSGKNDALATTADLYNAKSILIVAPTSRSSIPSSPIRPARISAITPPTSTPSLPARFAKIIKPAPASA